MNNTYQNIDIKQALIWLIGRLIFLAVLIAIEIIYVSYVLNLNQASEYFNLLYIVNITYLVLMCLQGVNTFIMSFLQRYFWKYRIFDDKIEIYYGVINKITIVVPVARIQQVSLARSLIDRIFGLSRIVLTTAGSSVVIIGLQRNIAQPLLENLNDRVNILARQDEEVSGL